MNTLLARRWMEHLTHILDHIDECEARGDEEFMEWGVGYFKQQVMELAEEVRMGMVMGYDN